MLKSFTTSEKNEIESIAIGGFDGIHLAHQVLISKLEGKAALLVVHRGGIGLTPGKERCYYHDKRCMLLDFEKIKSMQASDFVHFINSTFINLKKIVVGYDFFFGKDRKGDIQLLQNLFDGEVEVVDEIMHDGISIHSRKIKEFLSLGEIQKAKALLGRDYLIKGIVVKGQGLGKKSLYPTLNIHCENFFIPAQGVYATRAKINHKIYPSVTFIGKRLSTDNQFSIESYILDEDLSDDIENVELSFIAYLRKNRKFEDLDSLKEQISKDINEARAKL